MAPIRFETHPDKYRHWRLKTEGSIGRLTMAVEENAPMGEGYTLKLNSYDLGVDIELADAIERLRFEHPEVRCVVVDSGHLRCFCSGANILMLRSSAHSFKVNFCKFTNETRLSIEDASEHSGQRYLAAVSGPCAGGGYELAMACDEIFLVDDGNSTVSFPEVPMLAVLPGTGGLTRLVDKLKVRRDRADIFSTLAEGIKGKRAVQWGLVNQVLPKSRFLAAVETRSAELAASSPARAEKGILLHPVQRAESEDSLQYSSVRVDMDRSARVATITVSAPKESAPDAATALAQGSDFWSLKVFRELNDALLWLRFNEPHLGLILLKTEGDAALVESYDQLLLAAKDEWFISEVIGYIKRTLKRLDLSSRSFFAFVEPGSAFSGTFLELALAADRAYAMDDPDEDLTVGLGEVNFGLYPMSNGWSRLQTRLYGETERYAALRGKLGSFDLEDAAEEGLITEVLDDIDWEDEIPMLIEERASFSPDALTGMEASLRFAGPETMETKIFGRLSAWQNWIFQRPNAVGAKGALQCYGEPQNPDFDWRRV